MAGPLPQSRSATLGFAILSHRDPHQLARLVDRLARLYPGAPITIHHDLGQSPLEPPLRASIERAARFVEPSIATRWGRWSLVDATIRTLASLARSADAPEWITLLSASDYPVAQPPVVLADLARAEADAFIEAHPVSLRGPCDARTRSLRKRYLRQTLWLADVHPAWGSARLSLPAPLGRVIGPFGTPLALHWGPQWFTCSRRAALAIADAARTHRRLLRWMRRTHIPDEAFIHTVIMNTPELRAIPDNRRFIRWSGPGAKSPETLTRADLEAARASGAHFARKFNPDDPTLDDLDRSLGL